MHILHLPETTSTMDVARQLVAQSDTITQAAKYNAVLADYQTHGRGRLGRIWRTFPSPHSMACTYIVRTPCEHLPLIAAWAVYQACKTAFPEAHLAIKWPNDVLLNGKKVAGLLCERLNNQAALVGIGLNLRKPLNGVPDDFPGTFLGSDTLPLTWAEKTGACLFEAMALYESQGWSAFHNSYTTACVTFGQNVIWKGTSGDTELTGLARGLNTNGHLELVADDGTVHIIHSGDVILQASAQS